MRCLVSRRTPVRRTFRRPTGGWPKNFIPTSIPKAEEKFKDVTAAYDLLNEPEKRARFDRGEIDGFGAERPQRRYYRDYAGDNGARTHAYSSDVGFDDFGDFSDADDFLSSIFRRTGASQPRRGSDVRYRLEVDFLDAINGATKTVKLGDRTIDVRIPPGTRDGQVLRLRGRGQTIEPRRPAGRSRGHSERRSTARVNVTALLHGGSTSAQLGSGR